MMLKSKKRYSVFLMVLTLLPLFQGCALWDYLKPPQREVAPPKGNRTEARELLHSFMQARMAGESEDRLRAYMSEEAWSDYQREDLTLQSVGARQLVGYRVANESDLNDQRFVFSTVLQETELEQAMARNITEDIVVSFREDEYRVSSVRFVEEARIRGEDGELVFWGSNEKAIRETGGEERAVVFNLQRLPLEFTPLGAGPEIKFGVGREGYSAVVLKPDQKGAAFASRGTHGFIGVLNWQDKTLSEQKVGEAEFAPVDLAFESSVALLTFSPDSRYLAAEINEPTGGRTVRIYQITGKGEVKRMVPEVNKDFTSEKYNLSYSRWEPDGEAILLRATAVQERPGAEEEKLGVWVINLRTGQREKMISR